MEPKLVTAPRLAAILKELQRREPLFHRREFGASRRQALHHQGTVVEAAP
jgi:hypothetical protein